MSAKSMDHILLATKAGALELAIKQATDPNYGARRIPGSLNAGQWRDAPAGVWRRRAADLIGRASALAVSLSIIALALGALTTQ